MKIQICGSMTFSKEMLSTQKKLTEFGHEVTVPTDAQMHSENIGFNDDLAGNYDYCINEDVIRANFKRVADAEAICVINHPKNDINGYIGASTLMEIGLAYYLHKKIFLLNPIPHFDKVRWAHEVMIMQPTILNGDLSRVR